VKKGERTFARLAAVAVAVAGLTACTPDAAPGPQPSAQAVENHFGPDRFGKIRVGTTEADALATGDLADKPVSTIGCRTFSYRGGPVADQKRLDEDVKLEKEADDLFAAAEKINEEAEKFNKKKNMTLDQVVEGADKSAKAADASAKSAEASARVTERIGQRIVEFAKAGGVQFGSGRLRMVMAPPKARTAAGIERGSSLATVKAAYESQGLKSTSESRWAMPVPDQPDWIMAFDFEEGRVSAMLFANTKIDCP
jgi:hypothetical protein